MPNPATSSAREVKRPASPIHSCQQLPRRRGRAWYGQTGPEFSSVLRAGVLFRQAVKVALAVAFMVTCRVNTG